MIDVTNVDMVKMIKKVYDLSIPVGMGYLHFTPEPLTDEEAESLINKNDDRIIVNMDYIKGRACKFHIRKEGDKLVTSDDWYDHTNEQYEELLAHVGINVKTFGEHGCACNCDNCQGNRG